MGGGKVLPPGSRFLRPLCKSLGAHAGMLSAAFWLLAELQAPLQSLAAMPGEFCWSREFSAIEDYEKQKEVKSFVAVGQLLVAPISMLWDGLQLHYAMPPKALVGTAGIICALALVISFWRLSAVAIAITSSKHGCQGQGLREGALLVEELPEVELRDGSPCPRAFHGGGGRGSLRVRRRVQHHRHNRLRVVVEARQKGQL